MDDIKKPESQNQLPEAPASATVKIKSPNGFEWLFTIRDEHASTLVFKMNSMEDNWIKFGWTPLAQNSYQKPTVKPVEYIEGRMCNLCGKRLIKGQSKDGSKKFEKCEDNRYNWQTKQQEGCRFITWL